mmetsp:Transcript_35217/g.103233  ORF Transcript_35217/g.103233 Transcript_35217/m.103233 type:complete len:303 (+) Transcript_35217:593-1501(+)
MWAQLRQLERISEVRRLEHVPEVHDADRGAVWRVGVPPPELHKGRGLQVEKAQPRSVEAMPRKEAKRDVIVQPKRVEALLVLDAVLPVAEARARRQLLHQPPACEHHRSLGENEGSHPPQTRLILSCEVERPVVVGTPVDHVGRDEARRPLIRRELEAAVQVGLVHRQICSHRLRHHEGVVVHLCDERVMEVPDSEAKPRQQRRVVPREVKRLVVAIGVEHDDVAAVALLCGRARVSQQKVRVTPWQRAASWQPRATQQHSPRHVRVVRGDAKQQRDVGAVGLRRGGQRRGGRHRRPASASF